MKNEDVRYKAKSLRGKWVKGFYWTNGIGNHFIKTIYDSNKGIILEDVEIDENTLCQCTGLRDKNGKEIYENDKVLSNYLKEPNNKGVVKWSTHNASFLIIFDNYIDDFSVFDNKYLEVIGNTLEGAKP